MNLATFIAEEEKKVKAMLHRKYKSITFDDDGPYPTMLKLLACVKVLSEAVGFYSVGKLHLDYEKFQTGKGAPNHVVGKFARQALSKCESIITGKK